MLADDIAALGGHAAAAAALWGSPANMWEVSDRVANAAFEINDEGTVLTHCIPAVHYANTLLTVSCRAGCASSA
jgi:hypothetical protein